MTGLTLNHAGFRFGFWALAAVAALYLLGTGTIVLDGLRDEVRKADLGLVLGSKVEADGTPSRRLKARLEKTLELYRAGYFPAVIASGGLGREGFEEAVVMRDYLVAGGIPLEQVVLDHTGVTTMASAQAAREIADERGMKSVLVVSQYFHLPRARLALRRCGFATVYSAHARYFEGRDVYAALRETAGYARYFLRRSEAKATPVFPRIALSNGGAFRVFRISYGTRHTLEPAGVRPISPREAASWGPYGRGTEEPSVAVWWGWVEPATEHFVLGPSGEASLIRADSGAQPLENPDPVGEVRCLLIEHPPSEARKLRLRIPVNGETVEFELSNPACKEGR